MFRKILIFMTLCLSITSFAQAQVQQTKGNYVDKFRQLDEILPTANTYRTAGGEPGHEYWQQRADYVINVTLDENLHRLTGDVEITYHNNSPDTMRFLWVQLDQNRFNKNSMQNKTATFNSSPTNLKGFDHKPGRLSLNQLRTHQLQADQPFGFEINSVKSAGRDLKFTVVGTKMRVDLPSPLSSGSNVKFTVDYAFNVIESDVMGGRGGYEHFPDDEIEGGGYIYEMSQWYPRMGAYTDYEAWTAKEFLGSGEFTQEFGNFDVSLTVPDDHIVGATGELQNSNDVMTTEQRDRLEQAKTADRPVFIVTPAEALENEQEGTNGTKTWHFKAEDVRDFAWAGSRKFIWDAMGVQQDGEGIAPDTVMAMSFYPNEAEPLWSTFSTRTVAHTMQVYSSFSFPYSYPVAQSVAGPQGGMEYPMITFNGGRFTGRPVVDEDGNLTYSRVQKRGLIGVIIHEIGHIYFPMTVNSDERQWTWMDEGINTFLQYQAEQQWETDFPSRRGDPRLIADYMASSQQMPIMTQSDSILAFGDNAYGKPAVALVVLRETILGRELFDEAFRTYARRWRFKRPTPYDFFRTMEEVSGVDLDWFWRGWFYSTDHVDISLDRVVEGSFDTQDPVVENARERAELAARPEALTPLRDREAGITTYASRNPEVVDFYSANDAQTVTARQREAYESYRSGLEDWEAEILASGERVYYLDFTNEGGVVMPIILEFTFADGSTEMVRIPAEVWRYDPQHVTWSYLTTREVVSVEVDPLQETADSDRSDNYFPRRIEPTRLELYRSAARGSNMMADQDQRVTRDSIRARPE